MEDCCLLCNTSCVVDKVNVISSVQDQDHLFIKNEPEELFLADEEESSQPSPSTIKSSYYSIIADEQLLDFVDKEFDIIPRTVELENKFCGGIGSGSRRNNRFCQPCSARLAQLYDLHVKLKALQQEFQRLRTTIEQEFKRSYLSKKRTLEHHSSKMKGRDEDDQSMPIPIRNEFHPTDSRPVKTFYSDEESMEVDLLIPSPPAQGQAFTDSDSEDADGFSATIPTSTSSGLNVRLNSCSVVLERLKESNEASDDNDSEKPKRRKTKGHTYPCKFCPKIYHNIRFYRRHMKLHNGSKLAAGEKLHKCPHCPKSFGRGYILTTHLRTHTGEKPYTCQYCDKKFSTNGILVAHEIRHTKVKSFGCHLCPKMFQFNSAVRRHLIKVHNELESCFPCAKCSKKFGWECELKRHVATKHDKSAMLVAKPKVAPKPPDPNKSRKKRGRKPRIEFMSAKVQRVRVRSEPTAAGSQPKSGEPKLKLKPKFKQMLVYYCDECPGLAFTSQETVDLHRRQEHNIGTNGEGLLSCDRCKSVFVNPANYSRHTSSCDEGTSICADCGKVFDTKVQERKHWRNVHLRHDFHQCEICGAAFKVKHNLELHRETKHFGNFSFTCQECGRHCPTKRSLNVHMVQHSGVKLIGCEYCELRFNNNLRKRRHLYAFHPAEYFADQPHGCSLCWKKFETEEQLAEHRVEMHGRFTCNICQKGFSSGSKFRHHMYIHTGERPYKCTMCTKTFNKPESLKDHMYRHTGERPYGCKECELGFFRKKELSAHVQKFHGGSS